MRGKKCQGKVVPFGDFKDAFQNELGKRVWSEGKEVCVAALAASWEN